MLVSLCGNKSQVGCVLDELIACLIATLELLCGILFQVGCVLVDSDSGQVVPG